MPSESKADQKAAGDLRNHAIDAILLGCKFPPAYALEKQAWTKSYSRLVQFQNQVISVSPAMREGIPRVDAVDSIEFFEVDIGHGYFSIDLAKFNWNRSRRSGHKLDPFGKTNKGRVYKRKPAMSVLLKLRDTKFRANQIKEIAHENLRKLLENAPEEAPKNFICWLQKSVAAGLEGGQMSSHPADKARESLLHEFVNAPPTRYLDDEPKEIPWTIGVRCLNNGVGMDRRVSVPRSTNGRDATQFYQADPMWQLVLVYYLFKGEKIDRQNPLVFAVSQNNELFEREKNAWKPLDLRPSNPLKGLILGVRQTTVVEYRKQWEEALNDLLKTKPIAKRFHLAQGCCIEKTDGSVFQLVNFKTGEDWMKANTFRDIKRIMRSPLSRK